ncbi:MAG: hypothetical protein ACKVJK_19630, partial [Methylophagaceae bacterium]
NSGIVQDSSNPPNLLGYGVDELYINETDNNGLLIQSALSNLSPGDQITLTVRTQNNDGLGPIGPAFNRTRTQTIAQISAFSPQVWRIEFVNF